MDCDRLNTLPGKRFIPLTDIGSLIRVGVTARLNQAPGPAGRVNEDRRLRRNTS